MLNKIKVTNFPVYTISLAPARPTAASVLSSQYQSAIKEIDTATAHMYRGLTTPSLPRFPLQWHDPLATTDAVLHSFSHYCTNPTF